MGCSSGSVLPTPQQTPSLEVSGHWRLEKGQAELLTLQRFEQISVYLQQ